MKRRATAARVKRRQRSAAVTVAVLAGVANVAIAEPAAAAPATPRFRVPVDAYQSYVGQSGCDPTAKPGVVAFKDLVLAAYPGTGNSGIGRDCNQGGTSEHKEGRAWDWGVSSFTQRHLADDLLHWLLATDAQGNQHALARRFGIMYIIWDRQIWRAYNPGAGWQPYSCSGVTDCHQDHVHFSFGWPGARQQTTWWTSADPIGKTTVGFYRPADASFHLTNGHDGTSEHAFTFGPANMVPIAGDWDNDGKTTVGFYRPADGSFHLKNSHAGGAADVSFVFGPPNMVPIAGDWNNDGKTTVGFYRPSDGSFHLTDGHDGTAEAAFVYGPPGMKPIAGDWNNDGKTTVGFYRPSDGSFHLTDGHDGTSEHAFTYGPANMVPIAGDWNADGKSTVGFYRPSDGSFHLTDGHDGTTEVSFVYGPPGMRPIAGDWNNQ